MDWTTIRVLTNNLGELLAQHERGEHVKEEHGSFEDPVRTEWWLGVRGLTVSLAQELNAGAEDFENMNSDTRRFWPSTPLEENVYTRHAVALVAIARKLLADMDAASSAGRSAEPTAAASP